MWMTARAMPTSCCWPPESWEGKRSFLPTMWNLSRVSATSALALGAGDVFVGEGEVDVFGDGEVVEEVVALEDHADAFAGEVGALFAVERVDGGGFEKEFTAPGVVEHGEDVEEGGFAGAGGAHDGDELAGVDGEVDAAEHPGFGVAGFVGAFEVL